MFEILIVGLGQTGQSIVRYCQRTHQTCAAWEPEPHADTTAFRAAFPDITLWQGELPDEAYDILEWVLSPGVPLTYPQIIKAQRRGIMIRGDVSLFVRQNTKPILAVTGSNGKSTVVSLLEKMVAAQGLRPALLGNIGVPVLDGLDKAYDYVILELSSFQLEIIEDLNALVGCVLNVTPDHLDRHGTMEAYAQAKRRIYIGAQYAVCNEDDKETYPENMPHVSFSMLQQNAHQWHYDRENGMLCFHHLQYPIKNLPIHSEIHYANVLAALAIIHEARLDTDKAFEAACTFRGLPHRLVLIADQANVKWYDDSKATNVGATLASIESVSKLISGRIVIILGGLGKGASFTCLQAPLSQYGRAAILLGEAKAQLQDELSDTLPCVSVNTLKEAVAKAFELAQPHDAVLLAPACASWDMFKNYGERGDQFTQFAKELLQSCTQIKE